MAAGFTEIFLFLAVIPSLHFLIQPEGTEVWIPLTEEREQIHHRIQKEQWKVDKSHIYFLENQRYLRSTLQQNSWLVHPEFWTEGAPLEVELTVFPPLDVKPLLKQGSSDFSPEIVQKSHRFYRITLSRSQGFQVKMTGTGWIQLGEILLFPFILGISPLLGLWKKGRLLTLFPVRLLFASLLFIWFYWALSAFQSPAFIAFDVLYASQFSGVLLYFTGLISFSLLRSSLFYAHLHREGLKWGELFFRLLKGYAFLSAPLGVYFLIFPLMKTQMLQVFLFLVILVASLLLGPFLIGAFFSATPLSSEELARWQQVARSSAGVYFRLIFTYESFPIKVLNAFVTGWLPGWHFLFLSRQLLQNLTEEEIGAVIAHEAAHIRQKHNYLMAAYLFSASGLFYFLTELTNFPYKEWFLLLFLLLGILGFSLLSRQLEVKADRYAFSLCGEAYRSALLKLASQEGEWKPLRTAFFSTHPPLSHRLNLLQEK
ncbi:MAG: M48 family metallopeptidase [bacterium JZ-2024 1]